MSSKLGRGAITLMVATIFLASHAWAEQPDAKQQADLKKKQQADLKKKQQADLKKKQEDSKKRQPIAR